MMLSLSCIYIPPAGYAAFYLLQLRAIYSYTLLCRSLDDVVVFRAHPLHELYIYIFSGIFRRQRQLKVLDY